MGDVTNKDEKTNYLMRCFRHTLNKDRENYVVLGIWHRLRMLKLKGDLKPITQQLVRRPDGRYALLDLYFPAIKLAVECDEAYHLRNYSSDRKREEDIFKAFAECGIGDAKKHVETVSDAKAVDAGAIDLDNLVMARVDASVPYPQIDEQLDYIVSKIHERYKKADSPSWDCRPPAVIVAEKGFINASDDLIFSTMPDVLQGLRIRKPDGTAYKAIWRGAYRVRGAENTVLWFPHLSYNAGGWSNILSDGGNIISESRGLGHSEQEEKMRRTAEQHWSKDENAFHAEQTIVRIVFAHSMNALGENGYRFMGVYHLHDVKHEGNEKAPTCLVWRKVSDRVDCLKEWYGYSLAFDYAVNTDEMECDLLKEARIHLSPFVSDWIRVRKLLDDGPVRYRVEFDRKHVSLECMHEIIGAYLFFNKGKIWQEDDAAFPVDPEDDREWIRQQM